MKNDNTIKTQSDKETKLIDQCEVSSWDDRICEYGEEEQVISHLQEKFEKSRQEIKEILSKL